MHGDTRKTRDLTAPTPLLRADNLTKHFPQGGGLWGGKTSVVRAVEDVSFTINAGETLGLVGESRKRQEYDGAIAFAFDRRDGGHIFL